MLFLGYIELMTDSKWKDKKLFYYPTGNLKYQCFNKTHKVAATGVSTWHVWKFTWVGTGTSYCRRIEGPIVGRLTGRTGMSWG